jgi:hypothetical protein
MTEIAIAMDTTTFCQVSHESITHVQRVSYSCDGGYVATTAALTLTRNEDTVRRLGGQQHCNDSYAP